MTAETHGLTESAEELKTLFVEGEEMPKPQEGATLLQPPMPLTKNKDMNWPLLTKQKGIFDTVGKASAPGGSTLAGAGTFDMDTSGQDAGGAWGDDDDLQIDDEGGVVLGKMEGEDDSDDLDLGGGGEGTGWDGEDDLELDLPDLQPEPGAATGYVAPTRGLSQSQVWANNSQLVYDHVAAGSFDSAFKLLKDQVGINKFDHYKEIFMNIYSGGRTSFVAMPGLPPLFSHPHRNFREAGQRAGLPQISIKLADLVSSLQDAYKLISVGKFQEAINKFRKIMLSVPLLVVDTKQQIQEAQQLVSIAKNYIVGFSMEIERKNLPKTDLAGQKRCCEMAAYITHCELQPQHLMLTLKAATNLMFKLKNFKMASSFAKRLLDLGPKADMATHARKIIAACDRSGLTDAHELNYDSHNPFDLCAASYTPIYRGKPLEKCPLSGAAYKPEFKDETCRVTECTQIGSECMGLRISSIQFRS